MQIKTINDYIESIHEKFPEVQIQDIKRICTFGFKSLYLHNSYGGDTLIKDNDLWCYIGNLTNNSLKHFNYYARKLAVKIRVLYKRKKIPWDGYYYFALTDTEYQKYLDQKNSKGRPKKKFKFGDVYMYKIFEECKIKEHALKYIFRIYYGSDFGYGFFKKDLVTDKAELIVEREPLKFEDILVYNNNYETI